MGAGTAEARAAARGRPRDERIDSSIVAATMALLEERGYSALTISAVAERAGTTTAAIYRRWAGKADLVQDVVFRPSGDEVIADTGDVEADLLTMVRWTAEKYSSPAGLAAVGGLLSEPVDAGESTRHDAATTAWNRLVGRLAEARNDGQLRPDADAEVLAGMVLGPVLVTAMALGPKRIDDAWMRSLVTSVLQGTAPEA